MRAPNENHVAENEANPPQKRPEKGTGPERHSRRPAILY